MHRTDDAVSDFFCGLPYLFSILIMVYSYGLARRTAYKSKRSGFSLGVGMCVLAQAVALIYIASMKSASGNDRLDQLLTTLFLPPFLAISAYSTFLLVFSFKQWKRDIEEANTFLPRARAALGNLVLPPRLLSFIFILFLVMTSCNAGCMCFAFTSW